MLSAVTIQRKSPRNTRKDAKRERGVEDESEKHSAQKVSFILNFIFALIALPFASFRVFRGQPSASLRLRAQPAPVRGFRRGWSEFF